MKNSFNVNDTAEFISRIDKLTPTTKPIWGKMDVAKMMAHCNVTYELEYENILYVTKTGKGQKVTGGFGGSGRTNFGVVTDKRVKRIGCFTFKSLIEEKKLLIPDPDVISELSTFIEYRGSYQADDGYHDDLVMPLVLFSWLTTNPYFRDLNDVNLREAMYQERIQQIEEDVIPFGFISDGQELEYEVDSGDAWSKEAPRNLPGYLSSNL